MALDALGDRTRRTILELLSGGERSVGEIAEHLPVSRPAVSQHLRVLERASLVESRRAGTRSIYSLSRTGLIPLRRYIELLWGDALDAFADYAANRPEREKQEITLETEIDPIRKSKIVALAPRQAFDLFTSEINRWWPRATHSVGEEQTEEVIFECVLDGRIYERRSDGSVAEWGRVTLWDPPRVVEFTWYPGRGPKTAGEVRVEFLEHARGTLVSLTHGGWERLGPTAAETRAEHDTGWDYVFGQCYVQAAVGRA